MNPVFILTMPRCRTAWLSAYLTGGGIFCFHEAWKIATTAKELRALMQEKGETVVNCDATNWLFLDEIEQEFPNARFIEIVRDDVEQGWSDAFGVHDWTDTRRAYAAAHRLPRNGMALTVDFNDWTAHTSLELWNVIAQGKPLDPHWHQQMHTFFVQVTEDTLQEYGDGTRAGRYDHIIQKLHHYQTREVYVWES